MAADLTRLLLAARDGDRVALHAFVRATQADVWRFCAHLVDRDSADDVCQDVYARALGSLNGYRGDASARTWLLAIARRTCADVIRRRQRHRRFRTGQGIPESVPDHAGTVDLTLLVDRLEPDRRAAFVLTQILGLSYADAAAACDVPIGTIRSRVARAREQLLETFDEGQREAH